jgi:photosystem II stability/assembly factor-like uncharacterized protein
MKKTTVLMFTTLMALFLCRIADAQITSMKLLTPQVGWAATTQKLYWTTDDGASWKDITPKLDHKWQAVSSVYFLGPSTGATKLRRPR